MKNHTIYTILCMLLAFAGVCSISSAADIEPIDLNQAAHNSAFFGKLNKVQAAELLENAIQKGASEPTLLRYLGVDPRIIAFIHTDQIDIRFKSFTDYSHSPVQWTREGSLMKTFHSKWSAISTITAEWIKESKLSGSTVYMALQFATEDDRNSTYIPLTPTPAGYQPDDVILAALILLGRIPPAETTEQTLPDRAPETPNAEAVHTPTATPTAIPTAAISSNPLAETTPSATAAVPTVLPSPTPAPQAAALQPAPTSAPLAVPVPEEPDLTPLEKKLRTLKKLYDDGLISQEIYIEKQRELLKDL